MSRRAWLWLLGVASVVIGLVLLALDGPMWDAGGPGIIGFELAGSQDAARDILVEWGDDGRDAARLSLWIDFLYLAAYGAFWALAAAAVGGRRTRTARAAVIAPILAAVCDACEDVALLLVLGGHGGAAAPVVAAVFATLKFALLAFTVGYVLLKLARRSPRVAAALAVAALVFVAVTVVVQERRTESGSGLFGVTDGDPRRPALLLIHGFSVDHHWWDAVVPALARTHRVVRVDLRGHGRSPKPRDGYSIEEQADLVADAARVSGVERATVVGHSLGGAVATALARRHPRLVSRLAVIGTPPEVERGGGDLTMAAAVWPVSGHLLRAYAPRTMIRARLEEEILPAIDLTPAQARSTDLTTWNSFHDSIGKLRDFTDAAPIDARVRASGLPFLAIFGTDDSNVDEIGPYRRIPGARVVELPGLGHSPQLERPRLVARLIADFADTP